MKIFITRPSVLIFTFALGVAAVFGIYSILSRNVETVAAPRIYTSNHGDDIAAIYSRVLKDKGYHDSDVFIEEFARDDWSFGSLMADKGRVPGADADTVANYRDANSKPSRINEYFADRPRTEFWTEDLANDTFGKDGIAGWKTFYERYSGSKGIVRFSNVGFNTAGDKALVFLSNGCGSLCGLGTMFNMAKAPDGTWYIAYEKDVWFS
jgi:hypothetical protein